MTDQSTITKYIDHYELIYLMQKAQSEKDEKILFVCERPSLQLRARLRVVDCGDFPEEYLFAIWLNANEDKLIFDSEPTFSAVDTIQAFELFASTSSNSKYFIVKDKK